MNGNQFGQWLRHLRKTTGVSQQTVADALGIDRTTYSCYERGVTIPNAELCVHLAQLYNLPVSDLIEAEKTHLIDSQRALIPGVDPETASVPARITELSKTERELICFYRSLSPEQREALRGELEKLLPNS